MTIQAESLQNAMQAVDYSNPGGHVHMDQMGMTHLKFYNTEVLNIKELDGEP